MSTSTLLTIQRLVTAGEVRVSEHGYDELSEDGISVAQVLAGAASAIVVEDYSDYPKGPSVLVLQPDSAGKPVHVVWGIPKGGMPAPPFW